MKRISAAVAMCLVIAAATQAGSKGRFEESDIPVAESKASLYELLDVGDTSPLGATADSIAPDKMVSEAQAFFSGSDGHRQDAREAVYWLRRAFKVGDAKWRSYAVSRLGLAYANGEGVGASLDAARQLWEIAAASGNVVSLYNLGELAESRDSGNIPDKRAARTWYERAQKAGYQKAAAALERLGR